MALLSPLSKLLPNVPQNLSFTATTDSVTVTWDAVDGATSYDVYRSGNKIDNTTETTYVSSGLKADTQYTFAVAAVNEVGASDKSENLVTRTQKEPTTESSSS
ncbi:fibronectin type III domain-containing protein [Bacillus tequilensis]|nr:fibronectin type III domain-containing protein [Bacillus tequilensis]